MWICGAAEQIADDDDGDGFFAAFTVMGHKTGVNQMVLSRSAFGRRGASAGE